MSTLFASMILLGLIVAFSVSMMVDVDEFAGKFFSVVFGSRA